MIETTLKTEFIPGTNLQGDMVSADWRFLLPALHVNHVLCFGVPSSPNLAVLATIGQHVHILSDQKDGLHRIRAACEKAELDNFEFHQVQSFNRLPFDDGFFQVIRIPKEDMTQRFLGETSLQDELARILAVDGVLHYDLRNRKARAVNNALVKHLSGHGFSSPRTYWLTPFSGEMRTALPVKDSAISYFFFKNVIFGQSFKKRAMSATGRALSKAGMIGEVTPRRAVFLQKGGNSSGADAPPEFILSIAEKAGIDLRQVRFGLSTRGKFNANKVIYYLFSKMDETPSAVIKMTRAPEFNYRLQNEFNSLKALKDGGFVSQGTYPEALFFDKHNGLALLAQKAVHGQPFRTRTTAKPDCPIAADAINWLQQIASHSVNRELVTGNDVAGNLGTLFERFQANYRLTGSEVKFMENQLATLAENSSEFPLVFQHGDPGTWNILVSPDNKVIFIDWEAGEPRGIPLWDMFYFMRTFASWVERQRGSNDALRNFTTSFLTDSPFVDMMTRIVGNYCERIGLETELVKPLFYTCWMHRALKESTRLVGDGLAKGHYFNLLKLCIAKQDAPALRRMLQAESAQNKTGAVTKQASVVTQ